MGITWLSKVINKPSGKAICFASHQRFALYASLCDCDNTHNFMHIYMCLHVPSLNWESYVVSHETILLNSLLVYMYAINSKTPS